MSIFNATAPSAGGGGGGGMLISTPTTFENYDSSISAGYAEFPVDGMPTAFAIICAAELQTTSSYNFAIHASYNIFESNCFIVYYRTSSRIKGTTSYSPSNYLTYDKGLLKVELFEGIRFLGSSNECKLIYSV